MSRQTINLRVQDDAVQSLSSLGGGEKEEGAASSEPSTTAVSSSSSSRSTALTGRRLGFVVPLSILAAILFAVAPLSFSLPFAVVALLAPILTSCDCRHSRPKIAQADNKQSAAAAGNTDQHAATETAIAVQRSEANATFTSAAASEMKAEGGRQQVRVKVEEKQFDGDNDSFSAVSADGTKSAAIRARGSVATGDFGGGSGSVSGSGIGSSTKVERVDSIRATAPSELSLVRSEERMSIRKERVVTSRLVVRKVVTTEMVILSVPVRRERLEVETIYVDEPLNATSHTDDSANDVTCTTGYVRPLPPLPSDSDETATFTHNTAAMTPSNKSSGELSYDDCERHNYVGVNDDGHEVLELLLCEERPRIEMDIAAVTRVYVTKVPFPASQLVQMELKKEQLEYIPPRQTVGGRQAGNIITEVK